MKKLLVLTICVFGFAIQSQAQTVADNPTIADNAIGLRLGDSDGFGTEITYQRALGLNNRMELDLGWVNRDRYDAFRLTGLYQWVWNIEGGFNWYLGAGAGIGSRDFNDSTNNDDGFFGLIAGDVGIEYNFNFPLLLSLDFRPELGFDDYSDDLGFDIALGIKYQF